MPPSVRIRFLLLSIKACLACRTCSLGLHPMALWPRPLRAHFRGTSGFGPLWAATLLQLPFQQNKPRKTVSAIVFHATGSSWCKPIVARTFRTQQSFLVSRVSRTNDMSSNHVPTDTRLPTTDHHPHDARRPMVIVLAGPTAVGKSAVAARLAQCFANNNNNDSELSIIPKTCTISTTSSAAATMIVSADSVQAYRGVSIGANKPTVEEMERTPHVLVDVVNHDYPYNAAEWRRDAVFAIQQLLVDRGAKSTTESSTTLTQKNAWDVDDGEGHRQRQRQAHISDYIAASRQRLQISPHQSLVPLVVGGTMMYLQWLVHGPPVDSLRPSTVAREQAAMVIQQYQELDDWGGAVQQVQNMGTVFATQIDKLSGRDWYRLRRIFEVALTSREESNSTHRFDSSTPGSDRETDVAPTVFSSGSGGGMLYSGKRQGGLSSMGYDVRCFFLCPDDRKKHASLIDRRCEAMILRGLFTEVTDLILRHEMPDMAARAIGYRQAMEYLQRPSPHMDDVAALVQFINDFCTATRQYAKKQMQWFRRDDQFLFVPVQIPIVNDTNVDDANHNGQQSIDYVVQTIWEMLRSNESDDDEARQRVRDLSAQTRAQNAMQAKNMKTYISQRQILIPGTDAFKALLQQADACTRQLQGELVQHDPCTTISSDRVSAAPQGQDEPDSKRTCYYRDIKAAG